jgi:nucleoid-associated protein YgaU
MKCTENQIFQEAVMTRKSITAITCFWLVVFTLGMFVQGQSYDYKSMKMDEYYAEYQKWEKRLNDANAAIASEEAAIAKLQADIQAADAEYANCWNKIYEMLGTDEAGYNAYVQKCKDLENAVNAFGNLSAEEMANRISELDDYEAQLAELRKSKISLGPEPYSILQRVENAINRAREKANSVSIKYTVIRGDYLWKISGMQNHYSNPMKWMLIYSSNREQINDPNLIYPKQIFTIPKFQKPGTYWVKPGEDLTAIAKSKGNAFSWRTLYEANKDIIGEDPNMVYPHTVLKMPGN